MAFLDMPKPVEKVMHRLFAPKFDVSLEEIEDTLNNLNHIQDEISKDERGKLLQYLITVISGEAIQLDVKQDILKNHPSMCQKPHLAERLVGLVKDVKENKNIPLLCRPFTPDNKQSSNSSGNENNTIIFPNYSDNSSINFNEMEYSGTVEQIDMMSFPGASKLKDSEGCEKHALLIPGCAKFPMSRMMYEQEEADMADTSIHCRGSAGAEWCMDTVEITEEQNASTKHFKEDSSWRFMENQLFKPAPVGSTVSMDKYYKHIPRDGRGSSFNISSNGKRKGRSQQEGGSSKTARYHTSNEVLLQKVGTNCIMVGVKDKTNRFILPKPPGCTQIDKNDTEYAPVPSKGIFAKSKIRKRHGIDVMALCGGYKVRKVSTGNCGLPSTGNCGLPRGKTGRGNTRNAFQAGNRGLSYFEGARKGTSIKDLNESRYCLWENVPQAENILSSEQNDSQQTKATLSKSPRVKWDGRKRYGVVSSVWDSGMGPSSLQGATHQRNPKQILTPVAKEGALRHLSLTDDLKADDLVGKGGVITAAGEETTIRDCIEEEEDADVLIIDEALPPVIDSDGESNVAEEKSHCISDLTIIGNTSHWNDQSWMPTLQDHSGCAGQSKAGSSDCEENRPMSRDQEKDVKHQQQIFQSNLFSESLPWCSPHLMHSNSIQLNAESVIQETDSQSNTSDALSLDTSSSADGLSLSQGSLESSLEEPDLPEYSFLFNLLKCSDEMREKDDVEKVSWKKFMPKKKPKVRRSRRKRRAKVTYQS